MQIDASYEKLLDEYLSLAPEGIDTRQGSLYYDAGAGFLFLLSRFYADLKTLYDKISLSKSTGEYLDDRAKDFGLKRHGASKALYSFTYEAPEYMPKPGDRFFVDGHFFTIEEGEGNLVLKADLGGTSENNILPGTSALPVESARGLKSISFGDLLLAGRDEESDEELRHRLKERLSGPAENGNSQHYKTWCEEVEGVHLARIMANMPTIHHVQAVIFGSDGKPAPSEVISAVQSKIDPNHNGDGSGKANMGAVFSAISANKVLLDVSVKITKENDDFNIDLLRETIENFLKNQNLQAEDDYYISNARLGYEIISMDSVRDYENLEIRVNNVLQSSALIRVFEYAALGNIVLTE